jgi:phage terminase small subunit
MPNGKLTPKQERFVAEYPKDLNATQAAIRAGYSAKTAEWIGPRLITNSHVSVEIASRLAQRNERLQVDSDWVLREYVAVWNAKITDILTSDWKLKPLDQWPEVWQKMTTPNEVKDLMERSRDGGEQSWDKIGELIKFNVFPKAEALKKIGEHVSVKAFEQPAENHLHLHLYSKVEDRLTRARTIEAESVA